MTLYRDSIAVTETIRKDRLMDNFHPVKITLTNWIVPFELYFLDCVSYYSCDIIVMSRNMISSMQQGTKIYKEKNVLMLYDYEMLYSE